MAGSDASDMYLLNGDILAPTHHNALHYLWKRELRDLLSHHIPEPGQHSTIADVGTCTGVWLLEYATTHPDAKCVGLDKNIGALPPRAWLPSNVSVGCWNLREEPPASLCAQFDIVRIHALAHFVMNDAAQGIRNIAMLLKPGGYLQWEEIDHSRAHPVAVHHTVMTDAVVRMDWSIKKTGAGAWLRKLGALLMENGFRDLRQSVIHPEKAFWKFHTDLYLLSWVGFVHYLPEGSEQKREQLRLLAQVKEEVRHGVGYICPMVVFVAQRVDDTSLPQVSSLAIS
ncbi:MAG: hypothetical protein LQ348_007715 [Seirophora lacunosa]|nr:MAG: hypothetical protein LQ348_007715 [Seirophora lacunosa]